MGAIKNAMVREADANAIENGDMGKMLNRIVTRLHAENERLRRLLGQEPTEADRLWWAEQNSTHDAA